MSNFPTWGCDRIIDDHYNGLVALNTVKLHLQKEIERHRSDLKELVPQRRMTQKKLKTSPQAKYYYSCGIYLLKALRDVEKEISEYSNVLESDQFLNNLQNNINLYYKQSAKSLAQEIHDRYAIKVKHPWLWSWMAFSITLQAMSVPTYAQPIQTPQNYEVSLTPETFVCPRSLTNETLTTIDSPIHSVVVRPSFSAPLVPSQFVYATPQLAANANAIKDTINCYWNQNSTKKKGSSFDCIKSVYKQLPDYGNLEIWNDWYSEVQFLPEGRSKAVLIAQIKQARENLQPGNKIIILARSMPKEKFYIALDMLNYCQHISILDNFKGKPVTGYYASFYSAYWGDKFHDKLGIPHINSWEREKDSSRRMLYNEMEYVDIRMSFYELEKKFDDFVPDNIVFETDLGEWASTRIAKVSHGDSGARHNVITYVNYYRAYHIGPEIYLFEPGFTPKLIDIDTLNTNEDFSGIYSSKFKYLSKLSPDTNSAVSEMHIKGIFTVFSQYFGKYKVSEYNPLPITNIRHFYVPDEYLDKM